MMMQSVFCLGLLVFVAAAAGDTALVINQFVDSPESGQAAALVHGLPYSQPIYSGYVEVRPDVFTFFLAISAESGDPNAPVLTWLQGESRVCVSLSCCI